MLILSCGVCLADAGGLADSAWPKFQRDLNNTGQSPYNGPQTNTTIWNYNTGAISFVSPAIGADGTIYIGSGDNKLYALNPNGTLKWTYTTGNKIYGSAAIGADGTIYIGSYDKNLYAINPDGTLKWTYTTGGYIYSSVAIGADGTIYIGNDDCKVYALNPDGTLKWTYTTGFTIHGSVAIGADGTIYIGSYDKKLYALNPDGTLKWTYKTWQIYHGSPAIGTDGTIYVGSYGSSKLYALNPDGTLKWTYITGETYGGTPAIAIDGTIYIGSYTNNNLCAINPDGTLKWTYTAGSSIYGSPALGADGTIYIGSGDKKVYAINPDGTLKWTCTTRDLISGSPSIAADGTLYIGSSDGKLYAFKDVAPVANFTVTPVPNAPLTIQFNDTSSYYPTSWAWDFGDKETSIEQNPVHTYAKAGNYTVTLTVTNDYGSDTETRTERFETLVATSITVSPVSAQLYLNETRQFSATATDQFGKEMLDIAFNWSSSNEKVGTVDASGLFTSLAPGTTNVTASSGNVNASAEVKVVGSTPDLTLSSVTFSTYPVSYNKITTTIKNQGSGDAGVFSVNFTVGGNTTSINVTGLNAGNNTTINLNDNVRRKSGDIVPIKVTVDPDNVIAEANETNNEYTTNATINAASGERYEGGRFSDGYDKVNTSVYEKGNIGVRVLEYGRYSWFNQKGTATYSAKDLNIPASATIKSARLYQAWTWYADPHFTVKFNGHESQNPDVVYTDKINGNYVFDVTPYFNADGDNTAVITAERSQGGYYGTVLVVVYEDASEPYRQIWINEGCDCILGSGSTYVGYTTFDNISTEDLLSAKISTCLLSGDDNEQNNILLNQNTVAKAGKDGSDPKFFYYDVTSALQNGTNELGVQGEVGNYFNFASTVLEVTKETTSEANFTSNVTNGNAPLNVKFTDTSTGTPTNWTWDFGDGSTSTEQNPTYIYKSEGNYTVKLTVSNSLGSDSEEKIGYIPVGSAVLAPETNFGSNLTSGNAPLSVQFKDESTNSPTSWEWNFGDGKTSTEQNPSHTYETVGTYTVNLTATNYGGSNTTTKTDYITITSDTSAPVVSFTSDANSGQVPFTVKFTDTSTGKVSSWNWDFGDSSTSTDQNPTHTYVAEGSYTVTLTATGPGGSNKATSGKPITVSSPLTSPNYNGGIPLTTAQNGTVSGGLWCDSYPGFSTSAQKTFTLPDYTKIKWARLYVTVYDGHMENNYRGNVSIDIDANGDSKYEIQKTESFDTTYSFPGTGGIGPVWLSDHMNRVTSDYLMWYDLTDSIKGNQVNVQATTTKVDSSFDGRVKAMTLVVAYDDGDSDPVYYWVNQGHDTVNPLDDTYTGSTAFGTSMLEKGWSSANLTAIFLASVDGTYSFQGTKLASGVKSGSYYGSNTWDISSLLTAGQDSKLDYNKQESNYYKIPLTLMSVRYTSSSPELPTADFKADETSGTAPLTVNFTDQSTGSPTSWFWDFDNDGTVDSSEQNPSHTYTAAGNYTVNLTVSSAAGNNSSQLVDLIKVTESPTPGEQPDLTVSAITPNAGEVFANETNNISAKVENAGTKASGPFTVTFTATGIDTNATVDSLEAGANATVTIADPTIRVFGGNVTVTAAADPENKIAEASEINNQMNITKTVVYNGYKGKRYTGGNDLLTQAVFEGKYGLVYSSGNTAYVSGNWAAKTYTWSSTDLPIPAGSMVESARLYQAYTWNKMATDPAFTMSFNSNTVTPIATYKDRKSYGTYDYPAGLYVYDVTSLFDPAGNSITVTPETGNDYGIYGAYLVVIYKDPAATEKKIWINDEFDLLASKDSYAVSSEEATAYASFSDVNATGISNAIAIAVLASGNDNSKSKFVFNDNEYTGFWPDYQTTPQIGFSSYNVTGTLLNGADTARLQSYDTGTGGDSMSAMNVILVADYGETPNETEAPVAVFTATPTSGTAPLTVNFKDQSTGTVSSYAWDFNNDGNVDSTEQNPSYTYAATGIYTVNLTVTGPGGSDSEVKTGYIKVTGSSPGKPVAAFSASPASGKTPLTVAFTDTSTGSPTKWRWSFGDGTTSTKQNPKHKYSAAGKYTVILTVSNAKGSNTVTETDYIKVISKPVANLTSSVTSGKAPLSVRFTDVSTGIASGWIWEFGDGSKSFVQNPTHKYSKAGTYTVNLTVKNAAGSNTTTKTEHIKVTAKPVSNFTSSVTSGKTPLNVKFTDTSTGTPAAWKWSFGDGKSSTKQNPTHKYSKAGTYTVNLTVKNAAGSSTTTKTDYIKVTEKPVAEFSATPTSGKMPLTVAFTDKSTGTPTKWKWNFGDGVSSTIQNPKHKYSKAGSYTVTLTATNAAGSSMITKTNYIKITAYN